MKRVGILMLTMLAAGPAGVAQVQQRPPSVYLLLVDDLHLDFCSTPRTRDLMIRRILPTLMRDGNAVSLVTTGQSSVSIAPSQDPNVVLPGVKKIMGGGLRSDEVLEAHLADERLRRAQIAIAAGRDAIDALGSGAKAPWAVLYFSLGYDKGRAVDLAELGQTASRANATIYVFEARSLIGDECPHPSNEPAWTSYYRDARDGLQTLADATGGQMVSTLSQLDAAMKQIAP